MRYPEIEHAWNTDPVFQRCPFYFVYQPQIILQSTCYIGKPRENMGTSFQYERARWQAVRTQSTTDPSKYTKATDGRMICHTKQSGCDFLELEVLCSARF